MYKHRERECSAAGSVQKAKYNSLSTIGQVHRRRRRAGGRAYGGGGGVRRTVGKVHGLSMYTGMGRTPRGDNSVRYCNERAADGTVRAGRFDFYHF